MAFPIWNLSYLVPQLPYTCLSVLQNYKSRHPSNKHACMGVNPGGDGGTRPPHEFSGGEMSPPRFGVKFPFFFFSSSSFLLSFPLCWLLFYFPKVASWTNVIPNSQWIWVKTSVHSSFYSIMLYSPFPPELLNKIYGRCVTQVQLVGWPIQCGRTSTSMYMYASAPPLLGAAPLSKDLAS